MFLQTSKTLIGRVSILLLGLSLGLGNIGFAQDINKSLSKSDTHSYSETENKRVNSSRYSLQLRNVLLKKALEVVSEKADLTLSYCTDLLDSNQRVSVIGDIKTEDALKEILGDTDLDYQITETRHLVIFAKEKIGNVVGEVFNSSTGQPLEGARVYLLNGDTDTVKKTNIEKGTYVDSVGKFDINKVEAGTYTLVIIFDGFKKLTKKVKVLDRQTSKEYFHMSVKS